MSFNPLPTLAAAQNDAPTEARSFGNAEYLPASTGPSLATSRLDEDLFDVIRFTDTNDESEEFPLFV